MSTRWAAHRRRLAGFAGNDTPLGRSIAAALSRIDELEAEVARLTKLFTEPELVKLELEPGGSLRMDLAPCLGAKVLAASFADMIGDAKNWRSVEVGPMPSDQGMLIVTVCRVAGKTPEEMVGELAAEVAELRRQLADERERTRLARSQPEGAEGKAR